MGCGVAGGPGPAHLCGCSKVLNWLYCLDEISTLSPSSFWQAVFIVDYNSCIVSVYFYADLSLYRFIDSERHQHFCVVDSILSVSISLLLLKVDEMESLPTTAKPQRRGRSKPSQTFKPSIFMAFFSCLAWLYVAGRYACFHFSFPVKFHLAPVIVLEGRI